MSEATTAATPDTASIALGRTLYDQRCAQCHDSDEMPGLPSREHLSQFPRDHIVSTLRYGVMQPQADGLSLEQIHAIAAYVTQIEAEENEEK